MPSRENGPLEVWFRLKNEMLQMGGQGQNLRPPSLRDACYVYVLSLTAADRPGISETTVETFVNGCELGCMALIEKALEEKNVI
jgi:hypothetical protein